MAADPQISAILTTASPLLIPALSVQSRRQVLLQPQFLLLLLLLKEAIIAKVLATVLFIIIKFGLVIHLSLTLNELVLITVPPPVLAKENKNHYNFFLSKYEKIHTLCLGFPFPVIFSVFDSGFFCFQ